MPIDLQIEFAAKMDWLVQKFGSHCIIGLSGGGDSLALAKLCADYQKHDKNTKFQAVIIDHAIAIGSGEVAKVAAQKARSIGIDARIMRVDTKITKSIQEEARRYRYELLRQAAHEFGANTILLAHNKDDQIETLLFRMLRKTGLDGLSGMRLAQVGFNPIHRKNNILARPLLGVSRDDLRKYLADTEIEHYDDPANENQSFARVKIRKALPKISSLGFDPKQLEKIGRLALELREISEKKTIEFLNQNLKINVEQAKVSINIGAENRHIRWRAIGAIIQALSAKPYLDQKKFESLMAHIDDADFRIAALANIQIRRKKNELIFSIAPKRRSQIAQNTVDFASLPTITAAILNDFSSL